MSDDQKAPLELGRPTAAFVQRHFQHAALLYVSLLLYLCLNIDSIHYLTVTMWFYSLQNILRECTVLMTYCLFHIPHCVLIKDGYRSHSLSLTLSHTHTNTHKHLLLENRTQQGREWGLRNDPGLMNFDLEPQTRSQYRCAIKWTQFKVVPQTK